MTYDWTFSKYSIEQLQEMEQERKLEAEKKRAQLSKDLTPYLIQFERLLIENQSS